jgi:hypothetical protein
LEPSTILTFHRESDTIHVYIVLAALVNDSILNIRNHEFASGRQRTGEWSMRTFIGDPIMALAATILRQCRSAFEAWRSRMEAVGLTVAALFSLAAVGLLTTAISFTVVSDVLSGRW